MRKLEWNVLILSLAFTVSESVRVPKRCLAPSEYPNIKLNTEFANKRSFDSGQKVLYSCDEDLVPHRGSRASLCRDGRWSLLTLKCEKRSCGNAGDLPNGQFQYEGNSFIGEKVYAVCDEGYKVKGLDYMVCKKDGWMGEVPTCEEGETTCPPPDVAQSMKTDKDASVYRVGDKVDVTCSPGFQLDGAQHITCGPAGQWEPKPPQCRPAPQDKPQPSPDKPNVESSCPPPAVSNSVKGESVSVHRVGEKLTLTCSPGFQLDGAQHITCGPAGQWEPKPPQCRPAPQEKTPPNKDAGCGVPRTIDKSNANLADKYITRKSFGSGERVLYVCDVGHIPAGGSRYRKCTNGQWTPLRMRCERKLCGSAGEINNGQFDYTGVEFGDTATAVCDEGFILVGHATRTCTSNGWSGRIPVCEVVQCEDPPQVANADMKGLYEATYAYRTVIRYQCRVGTLIGSQEVWCTKEGTWSAAPECRDMTCPPPNVTSAYWSRAHIRRFEHRDTLSMGCYPGYALTGPSSITCGENGQWLPKLPTCRRLY